MQHLFRTLSLVFLFTAAACQNEGPLPLEADKLRQEQAFEAADSAYTAFLNKYITCKQAWTGRGITRINLEHYSEAEADFSEAIRLGADKKFDKRKDVADFRGIDYFHRGVARYALTRYDEARQDFMTSAGLGHMKTDAMVQAGLCLGATMDYPGAIKLMTDAYGINPKDTVVLSNLAYYESLAGDNTRAVKHYNELTELAPRDKAAWLNLGYTYLQMGQATTALIQIEKALAIDADYLGAILYRGIALYDLGRYEEALKEFDYCEQSDPTQPKLAYYRGVTLIRLGRISEGCERLRFAREHYITDGDEDFKQYCK